MQEELKHCEEINLSVRQLKQGDRIKAEELTNELMELVKSCFPEKEKYLQQLKNINFNESDATGSDAYWQVQKDNLWQLTVSVQEELKLQVKRQRQEKFSKKHIENLEMEILRLQNDSEKDLILERNNHQYLQKKYEFLKSKHERLEQAYLNLLGNKNQWYWYLLITFPLVFFILTFDSYIYVSYFNLLKFNVLVKTGLAFAVISGLLYIPLRDKRLLVLPLLFITFILILQLI